MLNIFPNQVSQLGISMSISKCKVSKKKKKSLFCSLATPVCIYIYPKVVHVCVVHAHVCMIMKENLFFKKSFQTTNIANVCQQYPANRLVFFPLLFIIRLALAKVCVEWIIN